MTIVDVSFIIPMYNDAKHIEKCINHIKDQKLKSFEIIFIDDGSIDNPENEINKYRNFDNIRFIRNQQNIGPGASRNKGLQLARGEFVRFIDCDDDLPQESTKILLKKARASNCDVVRGGYISFNKDKEEIFRNTVDQDTIITKNSSSDNILKTIDGHWCYLFRKSFLLNNNLYYKEDIRQAEDSFLLQNTFFKSEKILFINTIVYNYIIYRNKRLTDVRSAAVVRSFQFVFENFLDICLRINRLDIFYKRFIKSFNYIYKERFFSYYDLFTIEEKNHIISSLKMILTRAKFFQNTDKNILQLYNTKISKFHRELINHIMKDKERVIQMKANELIKYEISIDSKMKKIHDSIQYKKSVPLYAWTGHINFGDILIFDLFNKLNISYHLCTLSKCKLITIGSILHNFLLSKKNIYSNKKLHCWGSGFISNDEVVLQKLIGPFSWEFNRTIEFHALRGLYTQTLVEKILNKKITVALGDPGILINRVFPHEVNKRYDVGIILHWKESIENIKNKISLKDYTVKYISPMQPPSIVINEIKQCNCILSSSLHGLIVADSFGIPNRHIQVTDKVEGGDFKFKDYYSAYENYEYKKLNISKFMITDDVIDRVIENHPHIEKQVNQICNDLLDSFPISAMQFSNIFRYIRHIFNPLNLYKK